MSKSLAIAYVSPQFPRAVTVFAARGAFKKTGGFEFERAPQIHQVAQSVVVEGQESVIMTSKGPVTVARVIKSVKAEGSLADMSELTTRLYKSLRATIFDHLDKNKALADLETAIEAEFLCRFDPKKTTLRTVWQDNSDFVYFKSSSTEFGEYSGSVFLNPLHFLVAGLNLHAQKGEAIPQVNDICMPFNEPSTRKAISCIDLSDPVFLYLCNGFNRESLRFAVGEAVTKAESSLSLEDAAKIVSDRLALYIAEELGLDKKQATRVPIAMSRISAEED